MLHASGTHTRYASCAGCVSKLCEQSGVLQLFILYLSVCLHKIREAKPVPACRQWQSEVEGLAASEQLGCLTISMAALQQRLATAVNKTLDTLRDSLADTASSHCKNAIHCYKDLNRCFLHALLPGFV